MILPAHLRPDSSAVALPEPAGEDALVLSVRSQGRWACWVGPDTLANALLRPGVLEFDGPAREWSAGLPLNVMEGEHTALVQPIDLAEAGPVLAPLETGLGIGVVDYDARQALFVQAGEPAACVSPEAWTTGNINPRHGWVGKMTAQGRFPNARALGRDQTVGLNLRSGPVSHGMLMLNTLARRAWQAQFAPGRAPAVLFEFPLQAPGWTIVDAFHGDLAQALDALGPALHPGEQLAWERWSQRRVDDTLARQWGATLRAWRMDQAWAAAEDSTPARTGPVRL